MKSIPGALTVLAGAALLAAANFTSSSFGPNDLHWHVIFVVGLILCGFGLFAPSSPVPRSDDAQPKLYARFRFSIRDLLWLIVVVAIVLGWWLDHRSVAALIPSGGYGGGGF